MTKILGIKHCMQNVSQFPTALFKASPTLCTHIFAVHEIFSEIFMKMNKCPSDIKKPLNKLLYATLS